MTKIHLLVKKEDINEEKMAEGNKIAVVLDVLLATTTIVSALKDGAKEVIPVGNSSDEAIELAKEYREGDYILAGELDAKPIDGFVYPSPTLIRESVNGKTLILSTTNGTVALRKSSAAYKVYIASLLNNPSVASALQKTQEDHTILIVCSGNSGDLSLEDFYGAGHLIDCLKKITQYELTDAAIAAWYFYRGYEEDPIEILQASYVGNLLKKYNQHEDLRVAASKGSTSIVPILKDGKVIICTTCTV